MYFDASERIAHKTNFPRSRIEKIDEFLAGQNVRRFELRQLQEKTAINDDVSAILEEYVRHRVLRKEPVYLCPDHYTDLKAINKREGRCSDCERVYPFKVCSTKLVYERQRAPDRERISNSQNRARSGGKEKPWWKQPVNVLQIIGLVITVIFGIIQAVPILFSADSPKDVQIIVTQSGATLTPTETTPETGETPFPTPTQSTRPPRPELMSEVTSE